VLSPASLAKDIERWPRQTGGHHSDVGREEEGQPVQAAVGLVALDLVETIQHQHDGLAAAGLRQPQRQSLSHLLGCGRDIVTDFAQPLKFAQQAVQEPIHAGAVGRGPEVVLENQG
jgi:hypothetical protein